MRDQFGRHFVIAGWKIGMVSMFLCLCESCAPIFAPPVRSTHYGPPGKLQAGKLAVGGAVNNYGSGGPEFSYAITDSVQVELGADLRNSNEDGSWVMGFGGLRFWPWDVQRGALRWVADIEVGGGAGIGGAWECDSSSGCKTDGRDWTDRFAWGLYTGAGFGLHWEWLSGFLRARYQYAESTGLPATTWLSSVLGVGLNLWDITNIHLAGGVGSYQNGKDRQTGPLVELGASVAF